MRVINRQEAIKVLYELHDAFNSRAVCVKIENPSSQILKTASGYQIRIKCAINFHARKCINPILSKYKLILKEEKDVLVLSSPQQNEAETRLNAFPHQGMLAGHTV